MLKLSMDRLGELFAAVAAKQGLYVPVEKADKVDFARWDESAKVRLDVLKTVKSAKDAFFPQSEDLARFKVDGKKIAIQAVDPVEEPFTIFGVRACDARSFEDVLDRVFLSDPLDPYYAARREHGTVVTLACGNPEETCFCTTFGIDPANPTGDVRCWIAEGSLYAEPVTEKGEAWLNEFGALFEDADAAPVEAQKADIEKQLQELPFANLPMQAFTEDLSEPAMMEKFNDPQWKSLSAACLGCGTCTFVCPTCQCYDIRDFNTGTGVQRYRCWDSCMYSDFTLMAHGNNRTSQVERFRQRFMHKLVYFPMNNEGVFSCVGCGRCVEKCPIHMNIVKVIKALGGKKNAN